MLLKNFVGLKPKMYSFFGDDKSEYKKVKEVNKNIEKVTMNIKMFC